MRANNAPAGEDWASEQGRVWPHPQKIAGGPRSSMIPGRMNPPPNLGIVTIGQTPRPDLVRAFEAHAPGARVEVLGALDGLTIVEIDALAARPTDYPLLVKLADGSSRSIGMAVLHPLVEARAQEFGSLGARVVVVACAGGFPEVHASAPVILPGKIVPAVVGAVSVTRRIGVVTPIRAQAAAAEAKWRADGFDPLVTWASPYLHAEIVTASALMTDPSLELVVLDCMGHDEEYRREFASLCGKPVLLAQSIAARVAGELANG